MTAQIYFFIFGLITGSLGTFLSIFLFRGWPILLLILLLVIIFVLWTIRKVDQGIDYTALRNGLKSFYPKPCARELDNLIGRTLNDLQKLTPQKRKNRKKN